MKWILAKNKVTKKDIEKVEEQLSIKFPKSFIEVIINNNGAKPKPKVFDLPKEKEKVFNSLIKLDKIKENYEFLKQYHSKKIVPFGNDPFGNFICFDFSKENTEPSIIFWNHELQDEKSQSNISKNFTAFLDSLYSIE